MPTFGSTCTTAVMLDVDNVTFTGVKKLSIRVIERFNLEGFIILKSSEKNYHVVFNRTVSWTENMGSVAWAYLESKNIGLLRWFLLQCIKGSSTLRVSPKGGKPSPRVVYRYGNLNTEVQSYLRHRKHIKDILRKMQANWYSDRGNA